MMQSTIPEHFTYSEGSMLHFTGLYSSEKYTFVINVWALPLSFVKEIYSEPFTTKFFREFALD